jgi:hypothetical protein
MQHRQLHYITIHILNSGRDLTQSVSPHTQGKQKSPLFRVRETPKKSSFPCCDFGYKTDNGREVRENGRIGDKCKKGIKVKVKDKAIPLQAWTGPEGSRRLRLPDFKTVGTGKW